MIREYYRIEKFVSSLDSAHTHKTGVAAAQNLKSKARPTGKALVLESATKFLKLKPVVREAVTVSLYLCLRTPSTLPSESTLNFPEVKSLNFWKTPILAPTYLEDQS